MPAGVTFILFWFAAGLISAVIAWKQKHPTTNVVLMFILGWFSLFLNVLFSSVDLCDYIDKKRGIK